MPASSASRTCSSVSSSALTPPTVRRGKDAGGLAQCRTHDSMVPLSLCVDNVDVPRPAGPVPGLVVIKTLHRSQGPSDVASLGLAECFAYPGNGSFVATAPTVRPHPTRRVKENGGPPPHHAPGSVCPCVSA